LETVRRLIGRARVYLAARDVERGRTAAEALGARFVELDVTSDASVRLAATSSNVKRVISTCWSIMPHHRSLRDVHEYTGEDVAAVLLTNVAGYVRVMHAFLPLLELSAIHESST